MRLRPTENCWKKSWAALCPRPHTRSTIGDLAAPVRHEVDRSSVVIRDQERAVLHDLHVDWSSNIFVVLEEADEERPASRSLKISGNNKLVSASAIADNNCFY
jgi:hypothetical protein